MLNPGDPAPSRLFGAGPAMVVFALAVLVPVASPAAEEAPATAFRELQLGYLAFDAGEYEAAAGHYASARDLARGVEQKFNASLGFGSAMFELGRLGEARLALDEAHRLKPNDAGATYTLGVVCRRQGELDLAIQYLAEAAVRDPEMTQAFVELGIAYGALERHSDAERVCRQALEVEPDHSEARLGLAVALYHQEKYRQAVVEFQKVLELDGEDVRAHYGLGLALLFSGDREGAIREIVYLNEHAPELADDLHGWVFSEN